MPDDELSLDDEKLAAAIVEICKEMMADGVAAFEDRTREVTYTDAARANCALWRKIMDKHGLRIGIRLLTQEEILNMGLPIDSQLMEGEDDSE